MLRIMGMYRTAGNTNAQRHRHACMKFKLAILNLVRLDHLHACMKFKLAILNLVHQCFAKLKTSPKVPTIRYR